MMHQKLKLWSVEVLWDGHLEKSVPFYDLFPVSSYPVPIVHPLVDIYGT